LLREKGRSEERLVLEMGEEGWRQEPRRKQGVFLKTHLPIQHALRLVSGFKPGSTPPPSPPTCTNWIFLYLGGFIHSQNQSLNHYSLKFVLDLQNHICSLDIYLFWGFR